MRKLHDLDEEIRRAEQRLEARRKELNLDLYVSRIRARRSLSSPHVLIGAVVVGFLIERLGRLRPSKHREPKMASGMSGIVAGLAAAALRSALSNPSVWQSLRKMWQARSTHTISANPPSLPTKRSSPVTISHGRSTAVDRV
ncbi:MAG TPA: hypothetical protein VFB54_06815 [Burkholderiales bacterium]|nr:hypothetical protein [Burkholderiales bacterium]